MNTFGSDFGRGDLFTLTPNGGTWTYAKLIAFDPGPFGAPTLDANGNVYGHMGSGIFKATYSGDHWSQTYYHGFNGGADGAQPRGDLYVDGSGNVFGVTATGGNQQYSPAGGGTIFEVTGSTVQTLERFCAARNCKDGSTPNGALKPAAGGNLVGVLEQGGKFTYGAVYQWTGSSAGLLYSFCKKEGCPDGSEPYGSVVSDLSGHMFGLTYYKAGGAPGGTIFELTP